ncbi:MAG: hypothetical protein G01um101420_854 [Parcubacteria group bacterium Gr01-1014_20]|nr:MAG: hypothetical protein G01um101420_854 [Parcubacteria group bacterium Gr01-1014_20]
MSQQEDDQKAEELYLARIFIEWLNKKEDRDYICSSSKVQQSLVDVYAKSVSGKFTDIKIQVTTAEADYEKIRGITLARMKKYGDKSQPRPISFNPVEWILRSLENKENAIGNEDKGQITLLLKAGAVLRPSNAENLKIPASPYKEIYVVYKPTNQSMIDNPVIRLK